MDGGSCQAVLVIVGAPGGKVTMGNWERFRFCVSIFLQKGQDRVIFFASISNLAYVGAFVSFLCREKTGE